MKRVDNFMVKNWLVCVWCFKYNKKNKDLCFVNVFLFLLKLEYFLFFNVVCNLFDII